MTRLISFAHRLRRDKRAATAVEYGLILALIFLAMIAAVTGMSNAVGNTWDHVSTEVDNAM